MKYILTGSLGNISRRIAEKLIKEGQQVSIISSNADKAGDIEAMGAVAIIGNIEDRDFVTQAFNGADMLYLMIPPMWNTKDWLADQKIVSDNYAAAIEKNNIRHAVMLSSIGAHMGKGAGPVDGLAYLESKLNAIPELNVVFLRPAYFYQNLFSMIPMIKNAGIMGGNQPGNTKMILVHPTDIADVAAQKMLSHDFEGKQVLYIASDEKSWDEITRTLTTAVGKENIPWIEFTDEQAYDGMLQAGLPDTISAGYMEMGRALKSGAMQADYIQHRPNQYGNIQLEDFSKEFVAAYNNGSKGH